MTKIPNYVVDKEIIEKMFVDKKYEQTLHEKVKLNAGIIAAL